MDGDVGSRSKTLTKSFVAHDLIDFGDSVVNISLFVEQTVVAVGEIFGVAGIGCDNCEATSGHHFERRIREAFEKAGF